MSDPVGHEAHDDCSWVLERLYQFLDGECPEVEADDIRHHLDACDRCVEDADAVLALKALVQRCCRQSATAPPELRLRLTTQYSRVSITRIEFPHA
nr:mycothiol system anti-sigma-R factor [Propionibacterium sp.]